jgi:hypothetical protein
MNTTSFQDQKNLWIGDSVASCHFTNDDTGMFNCKEIYNEIGVGNGNITIATKDRSICLKVFQKNGQQSIIRLDKCKYITNLQAHLFSITTALACSWKLSNKGKYLVLEKDGSKVVFDQIDPTTNGILMTVDMQPLPPQKQHKSYDYQSIKPFPNLLQISKQQLASPKGTINNLIQGGTINTSKGKRKNIKYSKHPVDPPILGTDMNTTTRSSTVNISTTSTDPRTEHQNQPEQHVTKCTYYC